MGFGDGEQKGYTIEAEGESEQKLTEGMKYVAQDKNSLWEQGGQGKKEEKKERKEGSNK